MTRPAWTADSLTVEPTIQDIDLAGVATGKYQLPSPGPIIDGDGFAFEVEWQPSAAMDTADFYLCTMDTADGNAAITILYQAATGLWTLTARSSAVSVASVAANQTGTPSNHNMLAKSGDVMRFRFWFYPARGYGGVSIGVNGIVGTVQTIAASGNAIPAPSAVYLGSNRGSATGEIVGQLRRFRVLEPQALLSDRHAEIVIIGDSTSAALQGSFSQKATHDMYTSGQRYTRRGIACIAIPGANIPEMLTAWQACRWRGDGLVTAVVIDVGINSADDSHTTATMTADYQALVDDVTAQNPNAAIVICETVPCKGFLLAVKWAELVGLNAAVVGGGITGADARVVSPAALNDGAGNLAAVYDTTGDHVHPSDAGRALRAAAVMASLQSLTVLP